MFGVAPEDVWRFTTVCLRNGNSFSRGQPFLFHPPFGLSRPGSNRFRSELEKSLCDGAGPGSEHIAVPFLAFAARVSWPPSLGFFERICSTRSQSTSPRVADRRISHVSIAARFTVVHTVSVPFISLRSCVVCMHAEEASPRHHSFVRLSLSRSVNHPARFASRTTTRRLRVLRLLDRSEARHTALWTFTELVATEISAWRAECEIMREDRTRADWYLGKYDYFATRLFKVSEHNIEKRDFTNVIIWLHV